MFKSCSDDTFTQLNFVDIPEYDIKDAPDLLVEVNAQLLNPRIASYGAFIIRHVEVDEVDKLGRTVSNFYPKPHSLIRETLPDISGDKGIHTDFGKTNDISLHHTESGQVDVAIFVGSKAKKVIFPARYERHKQMSNEIFDDFKLDKRQVSQPQFSYRARLTEGDLLVFDHSQPHVFRSRDNSRSSKAYYFRQGKAVGRLHSITVAENV